MSCVLLLSVDPSPLIPYVEGLGLKYHYIRDDIGMLLEKMSRSSRSLMFISNVLVVPLQLKGLGVQGKTASLCRRFVHTALG
jgi:hypothetical protein